MPMNVGQKNSQIMSLGEPLKGFLSRNSEMNLDYMSFFSHQLTPALGTYEEGHEDQRKEL